MKTTISYHASNKKSAYLVDVGSGEANQYEKYWNVARETSMQVLASCRHVATRMHSS